MKNKFINIMSGEKERQKQKEKRGGDHQYLLEKSCFQLILGAERTGVVRLTTLTTPRCRSPLNIDGGRRGRIGVRHIKSNKNNAD